MMKRTGDPEVEGKGKEMDSSRHLLPRLSAVACQEGQMQGEKEDAFLAWRKITVKLSSGENTPGMRERMGGGVRKIDLLLGQLGDLTEPQT